MRRFGLTATTGLAFLIACSGGDEGPAPAAPPSLSPTPGAAPVPTATTAPPSDPPVTPPVVPGDPVAALAAVAPLCSSGWCWRDPKLQGNTINAVYATEPDNIWLAGERGFALQWDGAVWHSRVLPPPPFPASQNIGFIGGTSKTDIWVGGGNLLYHWDGAAWALRHSFGPGVDQFLYGIWCAPGGNDVWVTADYGVVYHSTKGGAFQPISTGIPSGGNLGAIWGAADDDFWLVGRPGVLMHSNGTTFDVVPMTTQKTWNSLWGTSKTDVWLTGHEGRLFHWDGALWTQIPTGTTRDLGTVHGTSANDVFVEAFAPQGGIVLHWDGNGLTSTNFPAQVYPQSIHAVGGRVWAAGSNGGVHVYGAASQWKAVLEPSSSTANAIWTRTKADVWTAGPSGVRHWDGTKWTTAALAGASGGLNTIAGVTGPDQLDIWAAGSSGRLHHFDGTTWTLTQFPGETFNGVWAPRVGEAILVGSGDHQASVGARAHRFADGAWTSIDPGTAEDLYAVFGATEDSAYVVGAKGTILQWNRTSPTVFTPVASPTLDDLWAVHGAGGKTFITSRNKILESTAAGFVVKAPPGALDLHAVFARSATDVFVGGSIGQLYRYDGASFAVQDPHVGTTIMGLSAAPGANVWLTAGSAVLERTGP